MKQPPEFVQPGKEDLVCELRKALYGLKQAGLVWNRKFNDFLVKNLGFHCVSADPCIYIIKENNKFIILGLHVDDTLMVHNDNTFCDSIVNKIGAKFEITDLGEPTHLLGMRVQRETPIGPITLDQEAYICELLKRFNMEECTPARAPHQPNFYLTKDMCPNAETETIDTSQPPYNELIGGLLWLATNTRPDILPAVTVLCRFTRNPGIQHWKSAKLVLRYLKGTMKYGTQFARSSNDNLVGYVDSNCANDPDTRQSVTGYVLMYANSPIAVKSKRQSSVSTLSIQAEYQALCDAVRETVWLRALLKEIGHGQYGATIIHEDNRGCISITENNRTDPRTKHIDVKYHYTREQVDNKVVAIKHIPTTDMVADALTKPISIPKFTWCREHMGVIDLSHKH